MTTPMSTVVRVFSISIDGYGAGPGQSLENPLGVRGPELFDWFFHTRVWQGMHGDPGGGESAVENEVAARVLGGIGAGTRGRKVCAPGRAPGPEESGRGWWGAEPPYHTPVFVLTH